MLEQVDFERRFEELPQFNPDNSESGTPLPKSPRDIISSYRKKRRLSVGQSQRFDFTDGDTFTQLSYMVHVLWLYSFTQLAQLIFNNVLNNIVVSFFRSQLFIHIHKFHLFKLYAY